MNDITLNVEEQATESTEPRVTFVATRGGEKVLRREARVFSEDDMIATANELSRAGNVSPADIDQAIAELIEPIRNKWLRSRDGQAKENAGEGQEAVVPRYVAQLPSAKGDGPREAGIRNAVNGHLLANFVLTLEEDLEVQDDIESWREFAGRLTTSSGTSAFRIKAVDFADNARLKAALFGTGGCELVIHAGMDELRRAVSTISTEAGSVRKRKLTTNFGWTADRKAYLTPNLMIRQVGIQVLDEKAEVRVDLGSEKPACHLDMKKLEGGELVRVKRHVVEDLLALNDRVVTHTLLGATAAGVLYPFVKGAGRFALWLVGLTGNGKSVAAKLFSNFFGDFPLEEASFSNWGSSANFIQRQGYFFKDAMYLVDDYKPELVKYPQEVVRVVQAYADNSARGRLKSDATANVPRPIRGFMVSTGEDVPEHHASAVARSVIVKVPKRDKNRTAFNRCKAERENYSGVMADFIRWLLAGGRCADFERRFGELQERYYAEVQGQQNDIRVASNLALLGAAFEQFAEYLGDVWEGWQEASKKFVEEDLVAIRDGMFGEAKEQQASEVFLRTLGDLIRFGHVRIERLRIEGQGLQHEEDNKPLIGRVRGMQNVPALLPVPANGQDVLEVCTALALAEVNGCLRQQGRSELRITERALLQQLREDGKLLDKDGLPLPAEADPTRRVRLDGGGQQRAFAISRRELLGNG